MELSQNLLTKFKEYLENKSFKQCTVDKNVRWVLDFLWFAWIKDTEKITYQSIEDYKTFLRQQPTPKTSVYYWKNQTISSTTIAWKIQPIRNFLKRLNMFYNDWINYNLVITPKCKSTPMDFFEEDDMFGIEIAFPDIKPQIIKKVELHNRTHKRWHIVAQFNMSWNI